MIETAHAHAYRDALTGLPSRRSFDDAWRRLEGPVAIAMVDVDHFKAVNDTHGHDVGDQVLRMVAGQLED
ncbi:MAG: GGDEF domain-containing protein, partial [Gemmatimonadota bacterium]|nr:GGDEF domain-containing protein [Gemmatimonadota bacterium]